ncbi:MAG: YbaB/EbfC family nucleoid-associated protein [Pirellulales bacterium]
MFNLKNLSGLSQLMMNAGSIPERIKEMREQLAKETVSGGSKVQGAVYVEMSGAGEVQRLVICSTLVQHGASDQVEQLLPAALNEALAKVRKLHIEKMRELTGGVNIPGLDEALGGM